MMLWVSCNACNIRRERVAAFSGNYSVYGAGVINKIAGPVDGGVRWGITGVRREKERRVADFNMDAPASGCASDLSRRSYNPLSTDNAAASYRDRSRGSLSFRSPPPRSRGPRGHRCRCRLFKQQRRVVFLLLPLHVTAITLRIVFSTLVLRCRDFDYRPRRRCHVAIWPGTLPRSKIETGSDCLLAQIYIRERESRG